MKINNTMAYKKTNESIFAFKSDDLSFWDYYSNTRRAEAGTGVYNANIGRYLKEEYFSLCNKEGEYFVMVLAESLGEAKLKAIGRKAKDLLLHIKKEDVAALDDKKAIELIILLYGDITNKKMTHKKRK